MNATQNRHSRNLIRIKPLSCEFQICADISKMERNLPMQKKTQPVTKPHSDSIEIHVSNYITVSASVIFGYSIKTYSEKKQTTTR